MAICPECHTLDKPFFAPRCSECNQEIGFLHQCISSWIYVNTVLVGFFFVIGSVFAGWQWWMLSYYVVWVLIPMVVLCVVRSGFLAVLLSGAIIFVLTAAML